MSGESQQVPYSHPDPSVLTTEQMLLAIENLEKLTESERTGRVALVREEIVAMRRETEIREEHRRELKADAKEALNTAMIAAEKAVQAALAAAEKARDQQTIASQLATNKAEFAFVEQLNQQKETFTIAIAAVTTGFNDMKSMLGELRAERRGGKETVASIYGFAGFLVAVVVLAGFYFAVRSSGSAG